MPLLFCSFNIHHTVIYPTALSTVENLNFSHRISLPAIWCKTLEKPFCFRPMTDGWNTQKRQQWMELQQGLSSLSSLYISTEPGVLGKATV